MGLFSKLCGKKNEDRTIAEDTKSVSKIISSPIELYEQLIHIIVVSETLKSDLKIKLKQALENPQLFYDDQDEFILSERGLTYPDDRLLTPKFVLIDTLIDNNQMAEVDWKEDEEEIRFAINSIISAKKYSINLSDKTIYDNEDTSEIIALIDKEELQSVGYCLKILDIDSDSYVFTVVPLSKQDEVSDFFAQLQ